MDHPLILSNTILSTYRGSVAHGMFVPKNIPNSIDDIDVIGIVIAEPEVYMGLVEWGSRGTMDYWHDEFDIVLYEARKAFSLLLQGNPNIMSILWTDPKHQISITEAGRELISKRGYFVGKHVYNAFAGYAHAQMEKMETRDPAELREYLGVTAELKRRGAHPNHKGEETPAPADHPKHFAEWGLDKLQQRLKSFQRKGENIGYMGDKRKQLVLEHGYDAKNAAHLIRLLRMGIEFLRDGELQVLRKDAVELLDIKAGKWKLEDIKTHAADLFVEAKEARDKSTLPEKPDKAGAQRLLVNLVWERLNYRQWLNHGEVSQ